MDGKEPINPYNAVRVIDVYGPLPKYMGLVHIGFLSQLPEKYVFLYTVRDNGMSSRTLLGLPTVYNETTDLFSWRFFKSRIPPLKRQDVVKAIKDMDIDATRPMTLLAVFGSHSITNPYVLTARL